jgi:hypothetical protein
MTTTTSDVPVPASAHTCDDWQDDDHQPYRVILGADRKVTDHALTVSPSGSSGWVAPSTTATSKPRWSTCSTSARGIRSTATRPAN